MNYDSRIELAQRSPSANAGTGFFDTEDEDRQIKRRVIIGAAISAFLLLALWYIINRSTADDSDKKANQAAVVTVISPGRATIAGTINGTGTIAARREMPVGSVGEGGQVAAVLVEAGDWVRQGQVLARIDRSVQVQQQASSAAQIQVAQADANLAQANYDRALKLVDRGFISKADLDRLRAQRDAAGARVRVAGAQLGELQARVRRLDILAPADGLLLERKIEPGQVVGAGSGVLFRIAKGGELELLAKLGEADLAQVAAGTAAEVTPVGSPKTFTGQVWQLAPMIDPMTRQGTVRIALNYAPELRVGGFAKAVVRSGTIVAPMLPDSALLSDDKGSYVYIAGKGDKVERRDIKTGLITDKGVAIVEGLTGDERVVLRAGGFLAPGETIKPTLAKP